MAVTLNDMTVGSTYRQARHHTHVRFDTITAHYLSYRGVDKRLDIFLPIYNNGNQAPLDQAARRHTVFQQRHRP